MAEFVQIMKDWRRMCKMFGDENGSCIGCKLYADSNVCLAVFEGEMDYERIEETVTAWAVEHPEPVYETWFEWLKSVGALPTNQTICHRGLEQPIPADIAEKLGIEPKEST